ncbi:uncharacterized protein LOC123545092 [Mercenaria mercenaria]|uniref:uncharacterized protein LOC123545092 n=1 Tax=Mercenaria mercenaria TaxID=6596 RepID=UPI00234F0B60|nr:uncharacterized protein LOC123545092 [Mercenaria mercenaria]XP_045187310.2 uncharacterized protein LOC123545092 [Mercenaria mercenaria]
MSNKEEAKQLVFNVDLCKQAVHHLEFLKTVGSVPELKQSDILRRAVYRYETLWLPLVVAHPEECLAAPLDIEWVWHCHMLNPEAYERDCRTAVGTTVNHTLYSKTQFQKKQNESQKYWLQTYESEDKPFTIDFTTPENLKDDVNFKSKFTYDIVAAAERQMEFYYQVSLPHYKDSKFLEHSLLRYKQFLFMKTQVDQDFLVPCYDIDLIWHTHQLNPLVYREDMVRIIGHLFNHDDNVGGRSEDSKLNNAGKQTSENWKTLYDESYSLFGAMYRGKSPMGRLHNTSIISLNSDDEYASDTKTCIVTLEKLTLTLSSGNSHRFGKFELKGASTNGYLIVDSWFTKCQTYSPSKADVLVWTDVGQYQLDTKYANGIRFDLNCQTGHACCKSETFVGTYTLDMMQFVNKRAYAVTGGPISMQVILGNSITLDIQGRFSAPNCKHKLEVEKLLRGKAVLGLEKGKYETVIIPDDIQQLFGPIALETRPVSASIVCKAATHRLKTMISGTSVFTVRVIHSQPMIMSVIQVFCKDKMVAVAHLIASDQLPLPTQVNQNEVTLNPKQGERAVLIKNNQGDWGILVGRWTGFKRGVAGKYSERAVYGSPGALVMMFYRFSTEKSKALASSLTFSLESAGVDLSSGVIELDTSSTEVAENIAMAFSISLLHVLCIPRPAGWQEGQTVEITQEIRGERPITNIPSDRIAFIIAAGLQCSTPSNQYMSSNYGNKMCTICGGNVTKYGGDWTELPGRDEGDPNSNGIGCGGRTMTNEKEFRAGIVGAGCGGCGGRVCRSECGGSCGSGKGACAGAYTGRSRVKTGNDRDNAGTGNGGGSSTTFTTSFDAAFSVCDIDNDSGGGGGGGGCGGGCD